MRIILNLIKKYPILKEFTFFCSIGLTNLFVDFFIYTILTRFFGLYYILAAVLSFIVAVSWSFYANKKWTFKYGGKNLNRVYIKFFIANTISILFHLVIFYSLVENLHIWDLLSKFIASVLTAFLNFALNKFWAFKIKSNEN